MKQGKFSRLGSIGAIPTKEVELQSNKEESAQAQESGVVATEQEPEISVYKIVVEFSEEEKDKFLDYKYQLMQKYGSATNREVMIEAMKALYAQNVNIPVRPESVRAQENMTRRVVLSTKSRRKG